MPKLDHYAILVAINHYPGLTNLAGPENDANEFFSWLIDPAGGDLQDPAGLAPGDRRVEIIRSSDFTLVTDPDDANPTETQFKKVLNRWLKEDGEWRDRVGDRLYIFFAGHGFTSGALADPALFTAQAQLGDTAHIAGYRYASKIQNSGFFDEVILIMDCCQDVLKASQVSDPSWSPPDRQRSSSVKFMQAYGAPRGKKAFETDGAAGPVHGYFSSVFMEAVKTAPAGRDGYVMARTVEDRFGDLWAGRFLKLTGYVPPLITPRDMRLYRRSPPLVVPPSSPPPVGSNAGPATGPLSPNPDVTAASVAVNSGPASPRSVGDETAGKDVSIAYVALSSRDPGTEIRIIDGERRLVEEGVGRIETKLPVGQYTARFRLGDAVKDEEFAVTPGDSKLQVEQPVLEFSSPIPLEETSTHHEYHYYPVMDLASLAVNRAFETGFPESVATLMVFARDSAHEESTYWAMPQQVREGLRVRRLDDETGEPRFIPCEVIVDDRRGYSALLLNDLPPGTYLLGIRRLQRDAWFWQEMVLTLASSWWRTEVYLDSVEDDFTGRRFDLESASVLIEPGKGGGSLYGSEARFTEAARIALSEGRLGVDNHLLHWLLGPGIPSPMLALYTAYALALSAEPDVNRVRTLCDHLKERWTERSADVKLLEGWCVAAGGKESESPSIEFRPDEVPMIAYGWEVAARLGQGAALPLAVQEHIGVWRISSTLWTQTQVPLAEQGIHTFRRRTTHQLPRRLDGAVDFQALSGALIRPSHELSPLQQALRRALIDAREIGELDSVGPTLEKIGAASGVDADVVVRALEGLLAYSSKGDEEFATLTV